MIKNELAVYENSKVFCFPGDCGKFYFTFDVTGTKDLYLLTIQEKKPQRLNQIDQHNQESEKQDLNKPEKFFTIQKVIIGSGLLIGILAIIFKRHICAYISFFKNR